jgi:hypothetical protein
MYLDDSELSSRGYVPGISPVPDFKGIDVGGEHAGGSERGPGAGGADAGDDGEGADPVGIGTDEEQSRPYQGQARSSEAGHC